MSPTRPTAGTHRADHVHGRVSHLGVNHNVLFDDASEVIAELREFQLDLANRLLDERRQAAKGKQSTPGLCRTVIKSPRLLPFAVGGILWDIANMNAKLLKADVL